MSVLGAILLILAGLAIMKWPESTTAPESFSVQGLHRLSGSPVADGNPDFDQTKRRGAVTLTPRALSERHCLSQFVKRRDVKWTMQNIMI